MCEARFALLSIAKPGAISPPPTSRQGRRLTLVSGAWKPLEWSFPERSKSNTLTNSRDHNRDPKECLFYRSFASPRFYTAKTHCGRSQPPHEDLFDHLVGNSEHARRNGKVERVGGLEVDDHLEVGRACDHT